MGKVFSRISDFQFPRLIRRLQQRAETTHNDVNKNASEKNDTVEPDQLIKDLPTITNKEVDRFLKELDGKKNWCQKWDLSDAPLRDSDVLVTVWSKHPNPKELKLLTINKCFHLTSVPTYVAAFGNLTSLNLRNNCIEELPWSIVLLKSLIYLDLSFNMLTVLPRTIGYLSSLEVLKLAGNHLTHLPTEILHLGNLKELDVSKNSKLTSPQLSLCVKGLEKVKQALEKRLERKNVWDGARPWVTGNEDPVYTHGMKSLLEICVDTIIVMKVDFLTMVTVPPSIKSHLTEQVTDFDHRLKLSKCSLCRGYFSTKQTFDNHICGGK